MYRIILFFCIIFLLPVQAGELHDIKKDQELREILVGTWIAEPNDNNAISGLAIYQKNGILLFWGFKTPQWRELEYFAVANWKIKNHQLKLSLISLNGEPADGSFNDDIVSASPNSMVLRDKYDQLQYRLKIQRNSFNK